MNVEENIILPRLEDVDHTATYNELDIYGSEPSDSDFCDESDSHERLQREQPEKWVVYNKLNMG